MNKLEEAGKNFIENEMRFSFTGCQTKMMAERLLKCVEFGANWQQERMYSEEEILPIIELIQWIIRKIDKGDAPEETVRLLLLRREKFEQFKKK